MRAIYFIGLIRIEQTREVISILIISTAAILCGFAADAVFGDPHGFPHIVAGMGKIISSLEKLFYRMKNKRLGGTLLILCVLVFCAGLTLALLYFARRASPWCYFFAEAFLCWQCIARKSLIAESKKVYSFLRSNDVAGARAALSMIVGRDTINLDEAGISRAAVETVAENTSDGVIAPMIFITLFGAAGGVFYKAVNTMDSMLGYKNERYIDFGFAAARLDDLVNLLPSRFCALLMIAASRLCGLDTKKAFQIWRRDRLNHLSPNSAQTEAAAAGALGVTLGGDNYYSGRLCEKPAIGDDTRPIAAEDIIRSHKLLTGAALIMLVISVFLRGIAYVVL